MASSWKGLYPRPFVFGVLMALNLDITEYPYLHLLLLQITFPLTHSQEEHLSGAHCRERNESQIQQFGSHQSFSIERATQQLVLQPRLRHYDFNSRQPTSTARFSIFLTHPIQRIACTRHFQLHTSSHHTYDSHFQQLSSLFFSDMKCTG